MPDRDFLSAVSFLCETRTVGITAAGLALGKTLLMRFEKGTSRLSVATDKERCLALLSVACARPASPSWFDHIETAARYWQSGEPGLANLRLVFSRLPRLRDDADLARVQAAEFLLDAGMLPGQLLKELGLTSSSAPLIKYDRDEPRVPAGQGDKGGQWTRWLDEPVPVYDQDTGIQVGVQSRARAIATNPLSVGVAGAAAMLGAEVAVTQAIIAFSPEVSIQEASALLPAELDLSTFAGLAGFARGLAGSSVAAIEATAEIVGNLKRAGVTRECITVFRRFYAGVARRFPQNLSAVHRVKLLWNIERGMK